MESDTSETSAVTPEMLALFVGFADFAVFTMVGYVALDDPAFGAIVGVLAGTGMYLLLPYVMAQNDSSDSDPTDSESADAAPVGDGGGARGLHDGAAGYALSSAGVAVLGAAFVFEPMDPRGFAIGGLVALLGYLVLSKAMPRAA